MPDKLLRLDPKAKSAILDLQMPGEPSIYMHLVDVFLGTTAEYLETMKSRTDEIAAIHEAAHSMRSASLSIGAQILGDFCLQIENERSLVEVRGLITQLEMEFLEVKSELLRTKAA